MLRTVRRARVALTCTRAMATATGSSTLPLSCEVHEEGESSQGGDLVVLHGLFGQGKNWRSIGKRISRDLDARVHLLDLRNHGSSPHHADMSLDAMAADVAAYVEQHTSQDGGVALMGHSMGGKVAMRLVTTEWAHLVQKLIVVDVAPVTYASTHVFHQYITAMQAIDLTRIGSRADVELLLEPDVPSKMVRQFLLTNLSVRHDVWSWSVPLQFLLNGLPCVRRYPPGGQPWQGPCLVVSGDQSDYVTPESHPAFRNLFPNVRFAACPRAGHWVHAEQPAAFLDTVTPFLRE